MNESVSRELGELKQQFENTSQNLTYIKKDLTRLFNKIEEDSKHTIREIARVEGKINSHIHATTVQDDDLERRLTDIKRDTDKNSDKISEEKLKRTEFETEMKTGIRISKIFGSIAIGIAIIIGAVTTCIAVFL